MTGNVSTIGYEGATPEDFIATLKLANIELVVDIRELPISRKKGFAKNALSSILEKSGIGYEHLKGLGDPKDGREAARSGRFDEFLKIFNSHMKTEVARTDLDKAVYFTTQKRICLLCYERDFQMCHRYIVAEHLSSITGKNIRHLGVREGVSRNKSAKKEILAAYA
ncbi:MAG: DUF488 domain-containing protein [Rhodospirillaceae bacterium]|nr:DUF488 domain-containing protein [Rhodospirillaceae bacterium]